jgi:hypothetical protein
MLRRDSSLLRVVTHYHGPLALPHVVPDGAWRPGHPGPTAELLASGRTSGALFPVDKDFNRRIHGHLGSNQARREKT